MHNLLIILIIIIAFVLIILIKSKYEINKYVIKNEIIYDKKIRDKISIIFLSDLHEKVYGDNNYELINDILNNECKYIILGGDFIINSTKDIINNTIKYKNTIRFINDLSKLNEKYKKKIYFSFGNHELRLRYNNNPIFDQLVSNLEKNNITIIDDNFVELNNNIRLYAISIFKGFYNKSFIFNNKNKLLTSNIIKERLGELDKNKYNIILSHSPDYSDNLIDYGFDLVLSGHYHGGLIRLPIIGTVFSPDLMLFPMYSYGLYNKNGKYIYVSNGLGEHYLNIRFLNTPSFLKLYLLGE